MDLNLNLNLSPSTPSSTSPGDFPFLSSVLLENSPPKPRAGLSLDLETLPPTNKKGFFYQLLHSPNTDHRDHDLYFTGEGSSSNPFARVALAPQLHQLFRHPPPDAYLTATLPRGLDLHAKPPPSTPSPPPFVDASPESEENKTASNVDMPMQTCSWSHGEGEMIVARKETSVAFSL